MSSRLIADILVILHFGFIVFVALGGLLLLKYRWLAVLHLPAVVWGVLLEFNSWRCPLTDWENYFRRSANQSGYAGGFIEHYLIPLIYPQALTAEIQILLGLLAVVVNLAVYIFVVRASCRKNCRSFSEK